MNKLIKKLLCLVMTVALCLSFTACSGGEKGGDSINIDYSFDDDHLIGLCEMLTPNVVELSYGTTYGTGIIYTEQDGMPVIVTNFHLSGSDDFIGGHTGVRFSGETSYKMNALTVLGYSADYDVAFLKSSHKPDNNYIDLRSKLSADNRMGQRVLAIGNGVGTGIAAVEGIISQPNKIVTVKGNTVTAMQISAPINAGSSGSPLFNMRGELIGLNFAQTVSVGDGNDRFVDGVSYSIPITIVDSLYVICVKTGGGAGLPIANPVRLTFNDSSRETSVNFTNLGIYARFVNSDFTVYQMSATGAALEANDVILQIGGVNVTDYAGIISRAVLYSPAASGEPLSFTVKRGGGQITVTVDEYKRWEL